jgi:hypothetical protein
MEWASFSASDGDRVEAPEPSPVDDRSDTQLMDAAEIEQA